MTIILRRMASKRMAERQEELKAKSKISFFRKANNIEGLTNISAVGLSPDVEPL